MYVRLLYHLLTACRRCDFWSDMAHYMAVTYPQDSTKTAIGVVFFSLLVFGAGFYYGSVHEQEYGNNASTVPPRVEAADNVNLDLFWETWSKLDEKFVPPNPGTSTDAVDETSDQERVYGAISGMTASLGDPYTVFLPPTENEVFEGNIQGEFGGVGMEVGKRDGTLTVISPLEGTPAKEAGLQPGDRIVAINGTTTQRMSVQKAVQLIRGEVGTDVTLTILSEGDNETDDVAITRDTIQVPTIDTSRQSGAFVISLYNFSAQSAQLFEQALEEFRESGEDDLVIDLRGNAGGFLEAAVEVASHFIDEGKVIVQENYGGKRDSRVHRSRGFGTVPDSTDVVMLVNGGSASASEIVAGALRDHEVAEVVGTQTFGKGSVQELVELDGDTSLKVTVARWLTPNGTSISDGGITPDVEIEPVESDGQSQQEDGVDQQLEQAIQLISDN